MIITPIKTHKITEKDTDILKVLDQYISTLKEHSIVVVTSKIVAICEGRFEKVETAERVHKVVKGEGAEEKDALIKQEADWYLPRSKSRYNIMLTIKNNMLCASAGVDESNAFGNFILWPENPQKSANLIREHLVSKFNIDRVGVVITDSRTSPLRWGVTGVSLAHSGFAALKNYIGTPDLFGRNFEYEKLNIADSLAATAVVTMGEGKEQQPLAVIEDVPFVEFQNRNPTEVELNAMKIGITDDLYEPLLTSVDWKKNK